MNRPAPISSSSPSAHRSIAQRLWNTSPASITRALQRRVQDWRAREEWFVIQGGPAAGAELYLPRTDFGGLHDMVTGVFDAFLYEALKGQGDIKGATCWDIGAHLGYHALGFASLGAQVLAFEPNPTNAERLRMNVTRNTALAPRIRHLPLALSDRDGETTFVQSRDLEGSSSGSHLAEATPPLSGAAYAGFEQLTVATARIDSLIARGERTPDIIKMDIEGAEYLALTGAAQLLKNRKPLLLIEVHHICLMFRLQRLLLEAGYRTEILDEANAESSRCFIMGIGK